MKAWPFVVAAVAMVAVGGAAKAAPSGGGTSSMGPGKKLYAKLRAVSLLTEPQRLFIMLLAYGESRFYPTSHNDDPGEVQASLNAWDDNPSLASKLANLGHGGRASWCIGSGGYGGRLVPYFGDDMLDAGMPDVAYPGNVFEPNASITSCIINAWKLQQYKGWQQHPTVENLRAGFGTPGWVDDAPPDREIRYAEHARKVHLPDGFTKSTLTEFPSPAHARDIYNVLRATPV